MRFLKLNEEGTYINVEKIIAIIGDKDRKKLIIEYEGGSAIINDVNRADDVAFEIIDEICEGKFNVWVDGIILKYEK